MLLIRRNGEYVEERDDQYFLTKDISKAKDFNWAKFWFGKKVVLEGIVNKFGNGFQYIKQ